LSSLLTKHPPRCGHHRCHGARLQYLRLIGSIIGVLLIFGRLAPPFSRAKGMQQFLRRLERLASFISVSR
jgi:hypothetical protein